VCFDEIEVCDSSLSNPSACSLSIHQVECANSGVRGGLTGVVTDPSSAVAPDADVEIRDIAKGTTQATKTDREGVYRFFFLAPGRYALTVAHDGFRKGSRAVSVLLGPPVTVNVALELAGGSTTVKVTAEAPDYQRGEWRHLCNYEPKANFRSPEPRQQSQLYRADRMMKFK
jgi:hypothetical protein